MYQNKHLMSNQNNIPKIEKIAVAPRNDQAGSLGIEKKPSKAFSRASVEGFELLRAYVPEDWER
jgi:hypothetical protein